jgi:hypothetical protein
LTADIEGGELVATSVVGVARLAARSGTVRLGELLSETRIDLDDVQVSVDGGQGPLIVEGYQGRLNVQNLQSSVDLRLAGCEIRGLSVRGPLNLECQEGSVALEGVREDLRLSGDDLQVNLKRISGPLTAVLTRSSVEVDQAEGTVDIGTDLGDVTVRRAKDQVTVRCEAGDVELAELSGPVDVESDGNDLRVAWSRLPREGTSRIVNSSGDVTVRFPASGGMQVTASSGYGRIETNVPTIRVLGDGDTARGYIGRSRGVHLRVEAARGFVSLLGGGEDASD